MAAALAGAVVYGGLRFADSMNQDLTAGPPRQTPTPDRLPAPYGTLEPSQYGYGTPIARAAHGDVIAYAPHHEAQRMLTIPLTLTNHAAEPASYRVIVTVTVTAGDAAGVTDSAVVSSDGPLPPTATMSAEADFQSLGAVPSSGLDVRIAQVEKE
ncbi:hypothetical protein [Streptomyces olindensis]|uniref:hypothetical protein n=1 Tax=Streptomyces olindensis TaxID=358823 RepID=UPI00049F6B5E|nr:hypothetical protein DF19_29200 [Streptomyces olindensis]